jgi:hypothetical protein
MHMLDTSVTQLYTSFFSEGAGAGFSAVYEMALEIFYCRTCPSASEVIGETFYILSFVSASSLASHQ